jgi:hypothetical protein
MGEAITLKGKVERISRPAATSMDLARQAAMPGAEEKRIAKVGITMASGFYTNVYVPEEFVDLLPFGATVTLTLEAK